MIFKIKGGGSSFISDLKARITLNPFEGDGILASVFPSLFQRNASGLYEISGDVGASSDIGKAVNSIELESNQLAYYLGALGLIIVALVFFAFKK